jgi:hypothetical protein
MVHDRARLCLALLLSGAISGSSQAEDARVAKAVRDVDAVVDRGPFAPKWDSLAKFQVPEWYPRYMYKQDEAAFRYHVETWGPVAVRLQALHPDVPGREVRRPAGIEVRTHPGLPNEIPVCSRIRRPSSIHAALAMRA